jgi:hypothetical protein
MKDNGMNVRFPLLMSSLILCLTAPAAEKPANLIDNPSLEKPLAENRLPGASWEKWISLPDGASYQASIVNSGRLAGKALLIEGDGTWGGFVTCRVPLDRTKRYRLRGWLRMEGEAGATAALKLDYFDSRGTYLTSTYGKTLTPKDKEWTLVEVTDKAAEVPNARFITAVVVLRQAGAAWFDDLELTTRPLRGRLLGR